MQLGQELKQRVNTMQYKKLYKYQEKAIYNIPNRMIMNFDLGTGKTACSLVAWQRANTGNPLLIVMPSAKLKTLDWQNEVKDFGIKGDISYISYERLRLMDKTTRLPRWWQYTARRNGGIVYDLICDEAHALKNPQSKQSKALYEISRNNSIMYLLSGSPLSNGWIDFAGYSKLFGYTKGITEFKRKYCRIQDYKGFPEIVGYYNTDELDRQLKAIAYPLTREQALELPDKQFIGKAIQLPSKDQKRYTELRLTRENKTTGELLDNPSRLLSVLRQSTIDARLDNLLSIVNDTDDNIIIFYNYVAERKAILKLLRKTEKQILRYDGEQHDKLPASDSNIKNTVLLAHYKSGSTGLNLQWANVTIYFSLTYSYQEYEQSKGRTWRTGQTKKCLYYIFKVQNTVDEQIIDCLKKKQDFSEKLWIKKNT